MTWIECAEFDFTKSWCGSMQSSFSIVSSMCTAIRKFTLCALRFWNYHQNLIKTDRVLCGQSWDIVTSFALLWKFDGGDINAPKQNRALEARKKKSAKLSESSIYTHIWRFAEVSATFFFVLPSRGLVLGHWCEEIEADNKPMKSSEVWKNNRSDEGNRRSVSANHGDVCEEEESK